MLVLSRKVGEGIVVGNTHLVTVTAIKPGASATLQFGPLDAVPCDQATQMLRRDESWDVLPEVRLTLIDTRSGPPDKVRLGIECPRDVSVYRTETYEALQCEPNRPVE